MANLILASKLVAERITAKFDFTDVIPLGEVITEQVVTVGVHSGIDGSPEGLLLQPTSVLGLIASQRLHRGLPGVIYRIFCVVTSSSGSVYEKEGLLAVLAAPAVVPPIFATFLTSRPYPIEVIEALSHGATVLRGFMFETIVESFLHSSTLIAGELRPILFPYPDWPPESFNHSSTVLSGTMVTLLIRYTDWPAESFTHSAVLQSGTLVVLLISYPNWPPESFNHSATILSGTLV